MIKLTFACALVAASNAISLGTEGIEININGVDDNNNGDEVIEINIDMEDDDGARVPRANDAPRRTRVEAIRGCGRVVHSLESRHRTSRNRGSDKHRHAICPSDVTVSFVSTI